MSQELKLKIAGLWTSPNDWSEVPDGGLKAAENVVITDDSVLRTRKGQKEYTNTVFSGGINKIFNYNTHQILQYSVDKLAYNADSDTIWNDYPGSYEPPSGYRMRSAESNKNFYFTTTNGIQKLDVVTGPPAQSGVVRGLPMRATAQLLGVTPWLLNGYSVAYQALWGIKDANDNLILGAPSPTLVFTNSSGSTAAVNVVTPVPDDITVNHFIQVYRSVTSASAGAAPSTELQLAYERNPTIAEVSLGILSFFDETPDAFLGATLYTSPSQEGAGAANYEPPLSTDLDLFQGHMFYGHTATKQSLTESLVAVGDDDLNYFDTTATYTNGSPVVIVADATGVKLGQGVTGWGLGSVSSLNVNAAIVLSIVGTTITLSQNADSTGAIQNIRFHDYVSINGLKYFANSAELTPGFSAFKVFSAGSPSENIRDTSESLVHVINAYTYNNDVYAYQDIIASELPGKFLLVARHFNDSPFVVDSSNGQSFFPELPQTSTNDSVQNRIFFSKFQQPEAVPLLQFLDVGSGNFPIQRVIASRDTLFVFKPDGIFRIIGTDASSFRVSLLDNTARVLAPETVVSISNQICCLTDQGVVSVTDTGVQVLSRAIEQDILGLTSQDAADNNDFPFISFGMGYESERSYFLFLPEFKTDTYPTLAYVYNFFTQAWTLWRMPRSCGIVSSRYRVPEMGNPSTNTVYIERFTRTLQDYADAEFAVTILSYDGITITASSTADLVVGQTIVDDGGAGSATVTSITNATVFVISNEIAWGATATAYDPIPVYVEWLPIAGKNPGETKRFQEVTMLFRPASFETLTLGVTSSFAPDVVTFEVESQTFNSTGWGLTPWGVGPWGGSGSSLTEEGIRTFIPLASARALWIGFSMRLNEAFTNISCVGLSLQYNPMSSRFR